MRQCRLWLRGGGAWLCLLQVHSWDEGWDLHVYAENSHGCHWETFKIVLRSHKTGFSLGTKKVIDKVKQQHSGVLNLKVRDTLLDEGFSKAELPPVKQIQIYLNSKKSQVHPTTTLKGFKTNSPKWDQCMQGKVMILLFLLCMQENSQWNSIFLGCWWWRKKWKEATMWRRTKASCTN